MSIQETLVLTIKEDITVINTLLEDITNTFKTQEIKSWLFPTKPYDSVCSTNSGKPIKNQSYENCLEIAIDRLYVLMNVLLQYLNKNKHSIRNRTNLLPPQRLSLGLCAKMLWNELTTVTTQDQELRKTAKHNGNQSIINDKYTQTGIGSLNVCNSCTSATTCIKSLLYSFDAHHDLVKPEYEILEITQFGCMLKLTTSIQEALDKLYARLRQEKIEKEELADRNEIFRQRLEDNVKKLAFLEAQVNILELQVEKDSREKLKLREKMKHFEIDLKSKDAQVIALDQSNKQLQNAAEVLTQDKMNLTHGNDTLKMLLQSSTKLVAKCHSNIATKLPKMEKETQFLKSILEQYDHIIATLIVKLMKLAKYLGKIDLKLGNIKEHLNEISRIFVNKKTFCADIKKLFLEKISSRDDDAVPKTMSLKGNPIDDMTAQIEENDRKIKDLIKENDRLNKLLARFKSMVLK